MSRFPGSSHRTTLFTTAAVTISALIAWSLDTGVALLDRDAGPSAYVAWADPGASTSERDTFDG